jgi:two-component system copper resistance phosphate regulon response regulator CusR
MRILVVEDEHKTGDYLKKGLTESGFTVDLAHTGTDGWHLATTEDYDIVILDVMLPGMNGWRLVGELRKVKDTPVLFLTARDAVNDRVKGLGLGADDYLTKPFAFAELLARVRSLLRRGRQAEMEVIRVGDLEVDVLKRRATRSGARVDLTAKEFALLHLLASHPGEIMSRSLIASRVWDMNFDSDTNVVEVMVRRLRSKIDDPFPRKLIHTVRGMGYVCEERD